MGQILKMIPSLNGMNYCCVRLLQYLFPFYKSRVYMCFNIYFTSSPHFSCSSSGLLVFAHLGGIYFHSASIDNRLNLLYIHLLFIHTTALLIDLPFLHMSALCHVTPYLYYSALISLYPSLS